MIAFEVLCCVTPCPDYILWGVLQADRYYLDKNLNGIRSEHDHANAKNILCKGVSKMIMCRLFLSAQPPPILEKPLPTSILQNSIKLTNEPPEGLKVSALGCWKDANQYLLAMHTFSIPQARQLQIPPHYSILPCNELLACTMCIKRSRALKKSMYLLLPEL